MKRNKKRVQYSGPPPHIALLFFYSRKSCSLPGERHEHFQRLGRSASRLSWLYSRRGDIEFHVLNFGDTRAMKTPAARGFTHAIKPMPCRVLIIRCLLPTSGNLVENRRHKERRGSYWRQCVSP